MLAISILPRYSSGTTITPGISRKGNRKRTYLYVDEFSDYAEDSHVLFNLFEQARKYELGLIVAHQYLGQLPPQLAQSLAANTAIKLAGGVSIDDAKKLAGQMHTLPNFITNQPVGTFAAWVKGSGTLGYKVKLGRSAHLPDVSSLSAIRDDMRKRYGPQEKTPPSARETPKSGGGTSEVPETGEW